MDFLSELGIQDTNSGAYCGEWLQTTGAQLESRNPATGEAITIAASRKISFAPAKQVRDRLNGA